MMKTNDRLSKPDFADDRILKSTNFNNIPRTDELYNRSYARKENLAGSETNINFCRSTENKENKDQVEIFPNHCFPVPMKISDPEVSRSSETARKYADMTAGTTKKQLHGNRRKSMCPTRSADRQDPNFRGVTFLLQTQVQGFESHLVISAYFSNVKTPGAHSVVRNCHRSCGSVSSLNSYHTDCWSGSEEDTQQAFHRDPYLTVKTCASCATRRTPLWRDAEDGTPLCNACGIRFKKYKVRCSQCWHIPKKDIKTFPNCPSCGAPLRVSVCRRSW